MDELSRQLIYQQKIIAGLQEQLKDNNDKIQELLQGNAELISVVQSLTQNIAKRDAEIESLRKQLADTLKLIADLKGI